MATTSRSQEEWAAVMARFERREDGMTMRQFAEAEGVSFNALTYRVYEKGKGKRRRRKQTRQEVRLVPVEVTQSPEAAANEVSNRWLEAETPRGVRLRFVEGTAGEYVADLMSRMAARGV